MVWHFPPSACVHVTHGPWKMESKCEEVSSCWIKKKNNSVEERKGKEKKREKERKGGKEKKGEKKKRKEERKERRGKKKKEKSVCRGERGNKGKGLRFSVFRRSEVVSPRIKVGLLNESYE